MKTQNSDLVFPLVRHPFERARVLSSVCGVSMTHQSHKDLCDINKIVKRFERTGELPPPTREAQYADVSGLQGDLTDRINMSREILDVAGQHLDKKQKAAAAAAKQKQIDLEEEVTRLRQLEAEVKASQGKS